MLRTIVIIFSFCISASAWSGELITDPEAVKNIFNNKTVYGKHLKKDRPGYNVYFAPDGSMRRFTEAGEADKGKWHIDDKGRHCIEFDHNAGSTFCRVIMKGFADGIYFRVRVKGDKHIKVVKFDDFRDGDQVPKP